ncbi:hypothetical protein [Gordonia sp. MP11Mi]|uniref:hypothetical protein n=1 Tax=Gordonia sp. MP11Mi TaxID=3022769 RepID=UPI003B2116CA
MSLTDPLGWAAAIGLALTNREIADDATNPINFALKAWNTGDAVNRFGTPHTDYGVKKVLGGKTAIEHSAFHLNCGGARKSNPETTTPRHTKRRGGGTVLCQLVRDRVQERSDVADRVWQARNRVDPSADEPDGVDDHLVGFRPVCDVSWCTSPADEPPLRCGDQPD